MMRVMIAAFVCEQSRALCLFALAGALAAVLVGCSGSTIAPTLTTPSTDRAVLLAFYNATDGPNWDNDDNWLSDAAISSWHGVTIYLNGRVIKLTLFSNQLTGEIPAELGSLTNLEILDFYGNQLTGEISIELGDLANLEWLSLYGNQLTGEIPPELGNLAVLQALYPGDSQLTGEILPELGGLANLTWLSLNGNQLTGEIPVELASLAKLEGLDLSVNQLTGEIPA